jgi:hypothetical protein
MLSNAWALVVFSMFDELISGRHFLKGPHCKTICGLWARLAADIPFILAQYEASLLSNADGFSMSFKCNDLKHGHQING